MNDETGIGQLLRHHFAGTARRQIFDAGALDAVTRQVARTPQDRPGRWLHGPRSLPGVGRVAMVGIGALLGLLLLGSALFVGSNRLSPEPHALPQPYGPAANGALAYASGGDLWTADAEGRGARPIVTGPEHGLEPVFSHDGTRLAFMRVRSDTTRDLMVALAYGSGVRQLAADVVGFAWSPDDSQLAVVGGGSTTISIIDARGSSPTKVVTVAPFSLAGWIAWRLPLGAELILDVHEQPGHPVKLAIFAIRTDGTGLRMISPFAVSHDLTWSYFDPQLLPDGSAVISEDFKVVTTDSVMDPRVDRRDLDTGEAQPVPVRASDFARLSPDGRSILYLARTPDQLFYGPLDGSTADVPVGPALDIHDAVLQIDLSPDGRQALVSLTPASGEATTSIIDIATGSRDALPAVTSFPTWQRLAPEHSDVVAPSESAGGRP